MTHAPTVLDRDTARPQPAPWRDLAAEEIQAFRRDSAICLRGLYSPETMRVLAEELDEIADAEPASSDTAIRGGIYNWMTRDRLRNFVLFGPTARPVRQHGARGNASATRKRRAITTAG